MSTKHLVRLAFIGVFCSRLCCAAAVSDAAPEGMLLTTNDAPATVVESLAIGKVSLRRVIVFSQNETDIFLKHERGLTSFKLTELNDRARMALGLPFEKERPPGLAGDIHDWRSVFDLLGAKLLQRFGTATILFILVLCTGLYLYTSYLFWLICIKTETRAGLLVWLPVLQCIPLLRAAEMSGAATRGAFIALLASTAARFYWVDQALMFDLVNAVLALLLWAGWSLRICHRRKKAPGLAILLLVPGINYLALLYLAGSK